MNRPEYATDLHTLAAAIKQQARRLGFDLVGIAPTEPSKYKTYLRDWLDSAQHGSMHWLANRFEERTNVSEYMPGAESVICVAINYHAPLQSPAATEKPVGRIARYALGDDYHELIKPRLHQLADWIKTQVPSVETRCGVDTAPIMEKELAARAGVGWMGKNTCLIHPQIGSWLLLGEVICSLPLPADQPAVDRCGTCRRCLDACPTGALTGPYQMDARKCISYLTIEQREPIPQPLASQLGNWLYGCDICQEVCPWNHKAPFTEEPGFAPRFEDGTIDLQTILQWQPADYAATLRGSAIKRVKLPVLQRNAQLLLNQQAERK